MKGAPPPAPSMEHAKEGQFVLHETPVDSGAQLNDRPVLLWDVGSREVLVARGWMEFEIDRRIPARSIAALRREATDDQWRVVATLDTGESVDLVGPRPRGEVDNTLIALELATGVPASD